MIIYYEKYEVLTLSICMIFFGILNNIGVAKMSFAMPGFPSFLNYMVAIMSVPFFLVIAIIRGEYWQNMSWEYHKQYLILCIITALNWISVQYVAAWVDGANSTNYIYN